MRKIVRERVRRNFIEGIKVVKFQYNHQGQSSKVLWLSTDRKSILWAASRNARKPTTVKISAVRACTFSASTRNLLSHGGEAKIPWYCLSVHDKNRTYDFGCEDPKVAREAVLAINHAMGVDLNEGALL